MRKLAVIAAALLLGVGCGEAEDGTQAKSWPGLTVDEASGTIAFEAVFNEAVATAGAWHLVAYKGGSNGPKAFFSAEAKAEDLFDALTALGAKPGNNVTGDNVGAADTATAGDVLELSFKWDGAPKEYSLAEILVEKTGLAGGDAAGTEIRFGGNYSGTPGTNPSDETGCLICLYSCPAGITSNSKANAALNGADGEWRYLGNLDVLPADGTQVTITLTLK